MELELNYTTEGVDINELRSEQTYWNSNDGQLFTVIERRADELTIVDHQDGSVELVSMLGDSLYRDECIGSEVHPVKFDLMSDSPELDVYREDGEVRVAFVSSNTLHIMRFEESDDVVFPEYLEQGGESYSLAYRDVPTFVGEAISEEFDLRVVEG